MSTSTLQRGDARDFALVRPWTTELPELTKYARSKSTGNLLITDMPVFRSGSFRDSWGDLSTWDPMHMDQMVMYYDMLRTRGIFADVPVRDGHKSMFGGGEVVGYHTSLRTEVLENIVDGQKYTYLLASYEITEPDAQGKIERKTWRNRSSEVGHFRTNDEAEYWPVYMGFAFVDIPAVEGLNGFAKDAQRAESKFTLLIDKEANVTTQTTTPPAAPQPPAAPAPTPPAPPAQVPAAPQQHAAPQAPAAPTAPQVFSINGQQTTDYSAVQAHITALEGTIKEGREAGRNDFVDSLASGDNPKILASQIPDMKAFALDLSDAQFIVWKKQYETAPAVPQLQNHSGAPAPTTGGPATVDAATKDLNTARDIVKNFRAGGMLEDKVKKTPSYAKLVKAGIESA